MSAMWVIYLADVSQGLSVFFGISAAIGIVGGIGAAAFCSDFDIKTKIPMALIIAGVLSAPISILLPSKQTIYMMAAAKVGQDIVTAPETKEVGGKLLKLLNQKLDEQLSEKKK